MTCIVGLEMNGVIWIGGDSRACVENGDAIFQLKTPKVYEVDKYIIGVCGSPLMMNVIQYHLKLPSPPAKNLMGFMSKTAIPKIKECVRERGGTYDKLPDGSQLLVGVSGRLVAVDNNTQIYEPRENYHAIGSGAQLAKGCLYGLMLNLPELQPELMVKSALMASEKFSNGVGEPWTVLHGAQK